MSETYGYSQVWYFLHPMQCIYLDNFDTKKQEHVLYCNYKPPIKAHMSSPYVKNDCYTNSDIATRSLNRAAQGIQISPA